MMVNTEKVEKMASEIIKLLHENNYRPDSIEMRNVMLLLMTVFPSS